MIILDFKTLIGIAAIVLVVIAYIPYIRDVIKNKTIPHIYTWILWAFITSIAFALQLSDKAGSGAYVTFSSVITGCVVIFLSFFLHKGKRDITKLDTFFFILGFISLGFWVFAKQPVISTFLVIITSLLAFIPTIRKSWKNPHSETLSFYVLNSFRFALATIALQNYSIITTLYPITWFIANIIFSLMLVLRRSSLRS